MQALVIGIGSGNPDHLTSEAVAALNRVDVFLVADKGPTKHDLVKLREDLCRALIAHDHYRFVEVPDPLRGPDRERDAAEYRSAVEVWHDARARRYAEIIAAEVGDGTTIGFLVW
ncbi:MAG TPA: SAM-dependent methyltransferase, partial [Propionibacteriaceae bacterium]|nr:SAM-dependent methyltransferase [Propionibacteriaceae bacterium]